METVPTRSTRASSDYYGPADAQRDATNEGKLEALNKKLVRALAVAEEHASSLRHKADAILGSAPEPISPREANSLPGTVLAELNDTVDRLATALEDIGRQADRLGKLTSR